LQPLLSVLVVALGTVAVFAGVIAVEILLARVTPVDLTTESLGAATCDVA